MSSERKHNMEQDFHDRFNGWEVQPSPNAWDKIERRLDGKDNKKPVFWWWFGGIALLIALGTAGVWFLQSNNMVQVPQQVSVREKNQENNEKKEDVITPNKNIASPNKTSTEDKDLSKQNAIGKQDSASTKAKSLGSLDTKESTGAHSKTTKTSINESIYIAANSPGIKNKTASTVSNNINANTVSNSSNPVKQKEIAPTERKKDTLQDVTEEQKQVTLIKTDSANSKQVKEISLGKDSASATDSLTSSTLPVPSVNRQSSVTIKKTDSSVTKESQADSISKPKIDSTLIVKKDSVPQQNKLSDPDTAKKPDSTVNIASDTAKAKKAGIHFFSLSVYGSPEIGNSAVSTNNTSFDIKDEKNNVQFAGGLRASFNVGSRIEISIAAAYSQASINYQSNQGLYFDRYTAQPYVFSSSYGDMSVPQATMLQGFSPLAPPSLIKFMLHGYQYSQTIQFLNIPVNARFNITTGKFKTYIALGLNIQYALAEKAEVDLIKELETDAVKFNSLNTTKLNYAPTAAIGAEYDFAKHFGVFLEPNARYNLLSSTTNSSVKSNASFIGCALGLRINL
jgi:hypothetical protein